MQNKAQMTYYDGVMLWVGLVSAFVVTSLCIGIFSPQLVLFSGLIAMMLIFMLGRIQPVRDERFTGVVLFLIVIAIMFRIDLYPHYSGGQDQGLYVNMSQTMTRSGSVDYVDRLRNSLPDDLKSKYDSITLLGVDQVDDFKKSTFSVDFYPMHPAWMACATYLFGQGQHALSLLFFSLLSLLGTYLITMELTNGDKRAGYIVLLFSALNPGLVFFSKLPVGEILALCFSINSFYFLLRALRCNDNKLRSLLFVCSGLLILAFCFTRMTFPILAPVFFFALFAIFFNEKYFAMRQGLFAYTCAIFIVFALSWVFYIKYQPFLGYPMYDICFKPVVEKYGLFLLVGVVLALVLLYLVCFTKYQKKLCLFADSVIGWLGKNAVVILLCAIFLSVFSLVKLYTQGFVTYTGNEIGVSPLIFRFHSLYRYMLFISPPLFLLLFAVPFMRLKFQRVQTILVLFLSTTWLAILIQTPNTFYLYYYGRYLISEMVPYSLILFGIILSILMSKANWKAISIGVICLTVVYSVAFSAVQIGKSEGEDPEILYKLNNIIGKEDVVIYENGSSRLTTPLRLYFDKQIFLLNDQKVVGERNALINFFFDNSASKYGNVYLMENSPLNMEIYGDCLELVGKFEYKYRGLRVFNEYEAGNLTDIKTWSKLALPFLYSEETKPIYLYRMEGKLETKKITLSEFKIDFTQKGNSDLFNLLGISGQEEVFRWTDGEKAVISSDIRRSDKPISKCQLVIAAGAYTGGKSAQRLGVVVNGAEVGWVNGGEGEFSFNIPVNLVSNVDKVTIELLTPDAYSPSSVGQGSDSRVLGFRLKSLQFIVSN